MGEKSVQYLGRDLVVAVCLEHLPQSLLGLPRDLLLGHNTGDVSAEPVGTASSWALLQLYIDWKGGTLYRSAGHGEGLYDAFASLPPQLPVKYRWYFFFLVKPGSHVGTLYR